MCRGIGLWGRVILGIVGSIEGRERGWWRTWEGTVWMDGEVGWRGLSWGGGRLRVAGLLDGLADRWTAGR